MRTRTILDFTEIGHDNKSRLRAQSAHITRNMEEMLDYLFRSGYNYDEDFRKSQEGSMTLSNKFCDLGLCASQATLPLPTLAEMKELKFTKLSELCEEQGENRLERRERVLRGVEQQASVSTNHRPALAVAGGAASGQGCALVHAAAAASASARRSRDAQNLGL